MSHTDSLSYGLGMDKFLREGCLLPSHTLLSGTLMNC